MVLNRKFKTELFRKLYQPNGVHCCRYTILADFGRFRRPDPDSPNKLFRAELIAYNMSFR